jgi:acetate kinase
MTMNILIPNLGSTSLKYQIMEMPSEKVLANGRAERVTNHREELAKLRQGDIKVDAVVLKAAHAGHKYRGTYVVDDGVIAAMKQFAAGAGLHNAIYLNAIDGFQKEMPGVPIVCSFEPEFHANRPEYARHYGVPQQWIDEGVIKYGFHGASHQFVAERMKQIAGEKCRLVSCHLGGSSSVCAIVDGRSVDHTMGFSTQSGLENATRPGDLDVYAVFYMMERHGWSIDDVRKAMDKDGGLAGLSGIPGGDIRDLEKAAAEGNEKAKLALDVFVYEVKKTIGAYAAAMGGIDALTFAGGIGENAAKLRASICDGLGFLGIKLDPTKNLSGSGERSIAADDAQVKAWTIVTNEELIIARRAYKVLAKR